LTTPPFGAAFLFVGRHALYMLKGNHTMDSHSSRKVLFFLFAISGFAGLIYESVWSHYLKLLLGHAAYAQTLVLVLFMGGMALGAWACSRISAGLRSPLLAYAAVELVLGMFALAFDPIFRTTLGWFLEVAVPALPTASAIEAVKWGLAALLIFPACTLLGATFPLMSAGVLRIDHQSSGNALGWLYFTNSIGAVLGVLTGGFVLIGLVGLPGTLLTAGVCNIFLALCVYFVNKQLLAAPAATPQVRPIAQSSGDRGVRAEKEVRLLLSIAFLTGAASFMYEIGWIRMLSLVLGSATHSFELMLGAFILGLAIGSLWIRNRIDAVTSPLRLLAYVQILMATTALVSLIVYGWSFEWMGAIVRTLAHSETGYYAFIWLSQAICWALMLPVTFFAGMTLPLITVLVLRQSGSESAVGRVYAANTWGAIAGIVVAVNVAMPYLGLRNVVIIGAAIDLILGLWLFSKVRQSVKWPGFALLIGCTGASVALAATVKFDNNVLSSGVYRSGHVERAGHTLWHRDGRTASVSVWKNVEGNRISIITNGKPDASLSDSEVSEDDYTQISLATIPLTLMPDAKSVAVIGMGSGRSTHTYLGSTSLRAIHTIEIEPAMVEGARLFGALNARTFSDPRSHIHVEDAKTYFARHSEKFDIIMSEPSNPWVSGVASLFTQEFYKQARGKLSENGIFVQWLQLYEFDDQLLGSVLMALGREFEDYAIYALDEGDLLIAAAAQGRLKAPDASVLQAAGIKPLASAVGLKSKEDLAIRFLGAREIIEPFVNGLGAPANSDYFPFLDQHAAKHRFMSSRARSLLDAHSVLQRLDRREVIFSDVMPIPVSGPSMKSLRAFELWAYFDWRSKSNLEGKSPLVTSEVFDIASRLDLIISRCEINQVQTLWRGAVLYAGESWWPYMDVLRAQKIVDVLRQNDCKGEAAVQVNLWLDWLEAISHKRWGTVSEQATQIIASLDRSEALPEFVARETLLADYLGNGSEAVEKRLRSLGGRVKPTPSVRLLQSMSARRSGTNSELPYEQPSP
jgi:spermidine synthase